MKKAVSTTTAVKKKKFNSFDACLVGIPTVYYLIFLLVPCFGGLFLSLTNWKGLSMNISFVGLDNFKRMFQDPIFYKSLGNLLYLFLVSTVIMFVLAMFFAILLSRNIIRERNFYRTLFFFPSAVPTIIIAIMWMVVYNPSFGLLNKLLGLLNIAPVTWLGNPNTVMPSIIAIMIWKLLGFYMVLFIAAVLNIPNELYESARIDGANEIRQAFQITIPLMWEVIRTSLIFFLINSANGGFQIVYIMTQGGPDRASELLTSYMYKQIVEEARYGYGSAMGVALLVVTLIIALIILKVTERETYTY